MTGMSMDMANLNLTVSLWYTVDGYSGKVLWLKVCRTNNDPAITGQLFLNAVRKYDGCPTLLRTDTMGLKMSLWLGCSVIFEAMEPMNLLG